MRVRRLDIGSLAKPTFREDGTMLVQARLARTGVQVYRNNDGTPRREYRPDQQVFSQAALDSFKLRPVTNDHPPDMLNAGTIKQYQVGTVGQDIHRDGKWIVGTLSITDPSTIEQMKQGKNQVSNGYDCDLVMESGVSPDGERYDCIQTNILGNHLAIVHNARAGADAAVRMDAAASDLIPEEKDTMNLEQALAELAKTQKELGAVTARADAADKALAAAKAEADKHSARADAADELLKKEKQAHMDAVSQAPAKVRARMALEQKATALLGDKAKELKMDSADTSDDKIKLAVIKEVTGTDCAGKSPAYIEARYDAALEQADKSGEVFKAANQVIVKNHTDGSGGDNAWNTMRDEAAKKQHTFIAPGTK